MDNCYIIDDRITEIRQTHSSSKTHAIVQPPSCRGRDRQAAAIKGPDIDNYPFLRACVALAPLYPLSVSFFIYFSLSDYLSFSLAIAYVHERRPRRCRTPAEIKISIPGMKIADQFNN